MQKPRTNLVEYYLLQMEIATKWRFTVNRKRNDVCVENKLHSITASPLWPARRYLTSIRKTVPYVYEIFLWVNHLWCVHLRDGEGRPWLTGETPQQYPNKDVFDLFQLSLEPLLTLTSWILFPQTISPPRDPNFIMEEIRQGHSPLYRNLKWRTLKVILLIHLGPSCRSRIVIQEYKSAHDLECVLTDEWWNWGHHKWILDDLTEVICSEVANVINDEGNSPLHLNGHRWAPAFMHSFQPSQLEHFIIETTILLFVTNTVKSYVWYKNWNLISTFNYRIMVLCINLR